MLFIPIITRIPSRHLLRSSFQASTALHPGVRPRVPPSPPRPLSLPRARHRPAGGIITTHRADQRSIEADQRMVAAGLLLPDGALDPARRRAAAAAAAAAAVHPTPHVAALLRQPLRRRRRQTKFSPTASSPRLAPALVRACLLASPRRAPLRSVCRPTPRRRAHPPLSPHPLPCAWHSAGVSQAPLPCSVLTSAEVTTCGGRRGTHSGGTTQVPSAARARLRD